MKLSIFLVILTIIVVTTPSVFAQLDNSQVGIFKEYNNKINDDGTYTFETHDPYIENWTGEYVPFRTINNDDIVQIEFDGGKLVFDKSTGALTSFNNDGILIKSDSYVVRQAELNSDIWNNLDVNNSNITTSFEELDDGNVVVTFTRENFEGVYKIEHIVMLNKVKTTAYFTNNFYENSKFAFTQTLELPDSIISINDLQTVVDDNNPDGVDVMTLEEIDLSDYVGQSFPRQVLEENQDLILQIKDIYYNSGLGFDNLHSVSILENNKIALDYANVQETQTAIGQTVELDPTLSYTRNGTPWSSIFGYNYSFSAVANADVSAFSIGLTGASESSSKFYSGSQSSIYAELGTHGSSKDSCADSNPDGSYGSTKYWWSFNCSVSGGNYANIESGLANGSMRANIKSGSYYSDNSATSVYGGWTWSVTYSVPTVPTAPQSLSIDTQDVANEITLNWSAPSSDGNASITNYKIYLGGSLIDTVGNVLTYDDTISGGEIGSSLTYKVVAVNSVGDSPDSNTATVTSWNVPDQVTGLSGTAGSSPTLNWSAPSSDDTLTNYKIYRQGSLHDTISASSTTYSDSTNVSSGSTYAYTVSAVSAVGEGAQSSSVNVVAGVPADPPTNVQAVISDPNSAPLDVTITYTNPTDVGTGTLTGFQLLRNGTAVSTVGLVNTISDTAPSGGNVFTYTVKSLSTHGTGTASSGSSVTTPNTPDQVTGLTVTPVSTSRIDLSWNTPSDNNSQISGYKVQISSNGGSSYSDVLTGNVNTVYQALSLNGNAQYHFKVSGINGVGTGTASDVKNTYTMTTTPASLTATPVSQVQINLAWGNSTGATGYKIEYESPVDDGFTTLVNNTGTTALTYSATGLTTATQYNFKVSGWNNGGTSVASPEASAYTWGILQAPVIDSVSRLSPTSLKVDWTTGAGLPVATGYKIERQLGSGWTILANNTGTTDVTYTDSSLPEADQLASYRIYAINTIGTSPVSNEVSSDVVASGGGSGGGGGGSSGTAVSSQTGVSALTDLTYIDQIHRVVLGQLLSKSINVAWDSSNNLEVKSIVVSDSPFRIVFQEVPFVLLGDPSGISNGKINYSVQIPNEFCTQQGQINCVEQRQYDIPVEIQTVHKGSTLTKTSVIKIDLTSSSDIPLVFVLLAIGAVPVAFILRKVGKGSSRRKASGSSRKSSKNGSNSKKVSL